MTVYDLPVHVLGGDGQAYATRARARPDEHGLWVGWLEFRRARGDAVMRTDIETTQPSLDAVGRWARGLGAQFLRGALERARHAQHAHPSRGSSA